MKLKPIAIGLIAAGLVIGGSATAHAATESPYVTVAWSYDAYPDLTAPQPFVAATPGADLTAFDALAASPEWCGKPLQVDVYTAVDEHGTSWETLKQSGALQYAHDGSFLAYNAGVGTPYRIITPKDFPCTTPTQPSGSPTPSASSSPTPAPSASPTATATPTPSASPSPTSEPTTSPSPSAPAAPTTSASPTATATPSAVASARNSTPNAPTGELAFTGSNPWPGIGAAFVLVAAGIILLIGRRVRRG